MEFILKSSLCSNASKFSKHDKNMKSDNVHCQNCMQKSFLKNMLKICAQNWHSLTCLGTCRVFTTVSNCNDRYNLIFWPIRILSVSPRTTCRKHVFPTYKNTSKLIPWIRNINKYIWFIFIKLSIKPHTNPFI